MIDAIGFDADDTLWHNETIFEENHRRFCALLSRWHDAATVESKLLETEMRNLALFGYGIKGFALSSIETAIELTEGRISGEELREILAMAKRMLEHPVELLPGARATVEALAGDFTLLLITKGDLRDQERKIQRSGLAGHFAHHEIVSEKNTRTYARILARHGLDASRFLMVGNSLRSDILPVLELGGHAVHVPYPLTWEHERAEPPPAETDRFHALERLDQLPALVWRLSPPRR
jgi:putative hydrolase of the HAD superfamily